MLTALHQRRQVWGGRADHHPPHPGQVVCPCGDPVPLSDAACEAGVKIYEYTPGFIHAKTFVVDDEYAVVGTINLDYRSLYLHFECAVWMYQTPSVAQVRDDFFKTQQISQEITLEECRSLSFPRRLGRSVLRVFAPLM